MDTQIKSLYKILFFLTVIFNIKCGNKGIASNNAVGPTPVIVKDTITLPASNCIPQSTINETICQAIPKNTYGIFKFASPSSSDTLYIKVDTFSVNKLRYRKILFRRGAIYDSLILDDKEPQFAFSSEKSSNRFLLFSQDSLKLNFGEAFNIEYDLEYLTILKQTTVCKNYKIIRYSLLNSTSLVVGDANPILFGIVELYVDEKMNILGVKMKNVECIFLRAKDS